MNIDIDLAGQEIIINPYINKEAKLSKEKFLERVADVKEIQTSKCDHYISFYICSLEEFENLNKFYDLVNKGKFDFKNYYAFAIAIQPKLYHWFKNTNYSTIEKQIVFWIASHYFFVPSKRQIAEDQLYKPLLLEIPKLIDAYYGDFELPNLSALEDEDLPLEFRKCEEKYLEACNRFYGTNPPEFLSSPFDYDYLIEWGINERFSFEFIVAYFSENDWEHVIINGGKNSMRRCESSLAFWEMWKHSFTLFDKTQDPTYSFFFSNNSSNPSKPLTLKRETIPDAVKDIVWRRDEGKCVKCGKNEKLEFDHIVPFSKGGSSSYRNLQLLCETCNRKKHAKIGAS